MMSMGSCFGTSPHLLMFLLLYHFYCHFLDIYIMALSVCLHLHKSCKLYRDFLLTHTQCTSQNTCISILTIAWLSKSVNAWKANNIARYYTMHIESHAKRKQYYRANFRLKQQLKKLLGAGLEMLKCAEVIPAHKKDVVRGYLCTINTSARSTSKPMFTIRN